MHKLILKTGGPNKLETVKLVKKITGLGLKESKDLVDTCPNILLEGITGPLATYLVEQFLLIGVIVEKVEYEIAEAVDERYIVAFNSGGFETSVLTSVFVDLERAVDLANKIAEPNFDIIKIYSDNTVQVLNLD